MKIDSRGRLVGIMKLKLNSKVSWIGKKDLKGWNLGFVVGKYTFWLKNIRFKSEDEMKRVIKSKLVLINN